MYQTQQTKEKVTYPTRDEVFRRLAICQKCPMLNRQGKCKLCGCYVENRASFSHQHCPMNEW
jgi:hypothetical protein